MDKELQKELWKKAAVEALRDGRFSENHLKRTIDRVFEFGKEHAMKEKVRSS